MTKEEMHIMEALAAPFDVSEIQFKPQATTRDGAKAMAVPYIDARTVMDRLDAVLGINNWQDEYNVLSGGTVMCRLKVRLPGGDWVVREDVGGESEQPDAGDRCKAAVSDAFKRAAVKFGIGRYLHQQKSPQWVPYDNQKKRFTETPRPPVHPSQQVKREGQLPLPQKRSAEPPAPAPTPAAPAPSPSRVRSVAEVVEYFDDRLRADGVTEQPGELAGHVWDVLHGKYQGPISAWPQEAYQEVKAACLAFANERQQRVVAQ